MATDSFDCIITPVAIALESLKVARYVSEMNNLAELISLFQTARTEIEQQSSAAFQRSTCASLHVAMRGLLQATQARAVGFWWRRGEELFQLSFVATADMPSDVIRGFQEATEQVAMTRIELGCVRAAAERRPIVAREDAALRGLAGSASWLQKFEATQSLAIPIIRASESIGVVAIATATIFDADSDIWKTLAAIAEALSGD